MAIFGHKAVNNKNTAEKLAMMAESGFDWNSVDDHNRYGSLIRRLKWTTEMNGERDRFNTMQVESKRINFSEDQLKYVLAPTYPIGFSF